METPSHKLLYKFLEWLDGYGMLDVSMFEDDEHLYDRLIEEFEID